MRGALVWLLVLCSCAVTHDVGTHDAGFDTTGCPAAPANCEYKSKPVPGSCEVFLACETDCAEIVCGVGSKCCPCEGCVPEIQECPELPDLNCRVPEGDCRWEGATECTCGLYFCGGECGGIPGSECPSEAYCDFTEGCGFGEETGACRTIPSACPTDCDEVCGCDAMTYCNPCQAAMLGVDILREGACP